MELISANSNSASFRSSEPLRTLPVLADLMAPWGAYVVPSTMYSCGISLLGFTTENYTITISLEKVITRTQRTLATLI